jgi:hypothetical protein
LREQRGEQAHLAGRFDFPPILREKVQRVACLLRSLFVQLTSASETADRDSALDPRAPPHGQRVILS